MKKETDKWKKEVGDLKIMENEHINSNWGTKKKLGELYKEIAGLHATNYGIVLHARRNHWAENEKPLALIQIE